VSEWESECASCCGADLNILFGCYFNIADRVGIINIVRRDGESIREVETANTSVEDGTVGAVISNVV